MWKRILAFLGGGLLGAVIGFAAGLFVYPYVFLENVTATEAPPAAGNETVVAKGSFTHVDPADPLHYGKGGVIVYKDSVRLGPDFQVGPGPKFHVYLVPKAPVTTSADVRSSMFVDLGRLRAFKGAQTYPVPAGVDLKNYPSVVIWCEEFSVLISSATLQFEQG